MEAKGHSQRWKMHLPEDASHSRRFQSPATNDSERGRTERQRDRGGPDKSVTMAPASSYLTDRRYVMRKPLFSAEQYTSILKKTHLMKHTEKEKQLGATRREENQQHTDNFLSQARAVLTPESFSVSHNDISCPSASRDDLGSPLTVSELNTRVCDEEPTSESLFPRSRSAQWGLSSSILEVQRLNPPLRPRLTSTVLFPTYTPRSRYSRSGQTRLRLSREERGGEGDSKLCSSGGYSEGHLTSPYQANYWACAIPKAQPPSPDRHSAGWDPNREYQDLLDYTYPLRPGHMSTEWDSTKLEEDSLVQTDPSLQDSGIEPDHLPSFTSVPGLGVTVSRTGQTKEGSTHSVYRRSPDLEAFIESTDGLPSITEPVDLSLDSLDHSKSRGRSNRCKRNSHHHQDHVLSPSHSSAFIRSTSVLPQSRCVCREVDEEFCRLPEQLEELQLLSRQVREVTAQLRRPVTASWESLGPGTASVLSSITLPEKQEAEDKQEETEVKEPQGSNQNIDEGKDDTDRETSAAQTADGHRDSEAVTSPGAWVDPTGGGLSWSSVREVEALVGQLCGLTLPGRQRNNQENQEQRESLLQLIQVFCSHLEQLIQRLYAVSEKMELLAIPTVDIDSVKSCLAEYQSFQREVSSHQPLATSVLHTGQLLLSCINTTSPFLRDTLLLIERQSGSLEMHTESFFSSILSAMDSLTQPRPVHQSREEDPGLLAVQGSTL